MHWLHDITSVLPVNGEPETRDPGGIDTLVLHCSDHGDYCGDHGLFCKGIPCFVLLASLVLAQPEPPR